MKCANSAQITRAASFLENYKRTTYRCRPRGWIFRDITCVKRTGPWQSWGERWSCWFAVSAVLNPLLCHTKALCNFSLVFSHRCVAGRVSNRIASFDVRTQEGIHRCAHSELIPLLLLLLLLLLLNIQFHIVAFFLVPYRIHQRTRCIFSLIQQ